MLSFYTLLASGLSTSGVGSSLQCSLPLWLSQCKLPPPIIKAESIPPATVLIQTQLLSHITGATPGGRIVEWMSGIRFKGAIYILSFSSHTYVLSPSSSKEKRIYRKYKCFFSRKYFWYFFKCAGTFNKVGICLLFYLTWIDLNDSLSISALPDV